MTSARCRAVIDVGTNSVKLLVAQVERGTLQPLLEKSEQTRLGQGFYQTHQLLPEAVERTSAAVAGFADLARRHGSEQIRVIATSAARDALNREALLDGIRRASGLEAEVLSGEEEADLVYRGVLTDARFRGHPLLIMDVGGGSTEFILGRGEHQEFRASFSLGTVRLLESIPHGDPPLPEELAATRDRVSAVLEELVCPALQPRLQMLPERPWLVGTGGTVTILARMAQQLADYDRNLIESAFLDQGLVRDWVESLWSIPLESRRRIPGLPPRRADVILPGLVIYEGVMSMLGFDRVHVSTRGLRFAALLD